MADMREGHKVIGVLLKYADPDAEWVEWSAEHDVLYLSGPPPSELEVEDRVLLEDVVGVHWDEEFECWGIFT